MKKEKQRIDFSDIPQLAVINELEKDLGVPPKFFQELLKEDDWSFIIKLHSLMEAAITQLLISVFDKPSLRDTISRLELSNFHTGKLAFVKNMELMPKDMQTFIQKLSELRNKMVHNVNNVGVNLEDYFSTMSEADRKGWYKAFKWGYKDENQVKIKIDDDTVDLHALVKALAIIILEHSHKTAIWLGSIIILHRIHHQVSKDNIARQVSRFNIEILELIETLIPNDVLNITVKNK
ncbi:MAG: hypothetical protein IPM66_14865 [Acidobacteriota bacterium]|nr:MAG: hypothetical protein IPM66_14865 [Acidobacteriota bacterium]